MIYDSSYENLISRHKSILNVLGRQNLTTEIKVMIRIVMVVVAVLLKKQNLSYYKNLQIEKRTLKKIEIKMQTLNQLNTQNVKRLTVLEKKYTAWIFNNK